MRRLCGDMRLPRVLSALLLLLLFVHDAAAAVFSWEKNDSTPVVEVEQGKVVGTVMYSRSGRPFYAYLGMPYAAPPLWELRFEVPQKPDAWDDVLNATKEGPCCAQLNAEGKYIGSEDCLYVNVFTHVIPDRDSEDIMRVMKDVIVVIHGGGFTTGSGSLSEFAPDHFMDHNIVLVTFNYRLGPLGFLAAGDFDLPGNVGLKDQSMVLRWVLRNIPMFGGCPHRVTLLGVEAGGASAHYNMFTPLSLKHFQRAISLSGTALSPWAHVSTPEARRRAYRLGQLVECPESQLQDAHGLKKCLSKKRAKLLVRRAAKVLEGGVQPAWPFVPVTEPFLGRNISFVGDDVETMIEWLGHRKSQDQYSWMIGTTSHEGLQHALAILDSEEMTTQLNEDPGKYLPKALGLFVEDEDKSAEFGRRIWEYYMQGETLDKSTASRLVDMVGDFQTLYGVTRSVDLHTNLTETAMFVYKFAWQPKDSDTVAGVPRGSELKLLFPEVIDGEKRTYSEEENNLINKMTKMIVNFAKEGDPTYEEFEELQDVIWTDALFANFSYMHITDKLEVLDGGFHPERLKFWESIMTDIRKEEKEFEEAEKEKQKKDWEVRHAEDEKLKAEQDEEEKKTPMKSLHQEL